MIVNTGHSTASGSAGVTLVYDQGNDMQPPDPKYWNQRRRLFSLFDHGIVMDAVGWYSVTPELIARHNAVRCAGSVIIDAFAGAPPPISVCIRVGHDVMDPLCPFLSCCGVVVSASMWSFAGCGGNAIQFAFTCDRVIAIEINPMRLLMAQVYTCLPLCALRLPSVELCAP
jgi:trimethylguanosine synthase